MIDLGFLIVIGGMLVGVMHTLAESPADVELRSRKWVSATPVLKRLRHYDYVVVCSLCDSERMGVNSNGHGQCMDCGYTHAEPVNR